MAALSGSDAIMAHLNKIARDMNAGVVSVGFMGGATYPDGTPVSAVAFWNEYGGIDRPARPFFRRMIAAESPSWPGKMARLAKGTNYDGDRVLAMMGEDVKGALEQSITEFEEPILAPSTVEAKGFPKPLVDTGDMLRAVTYRLNVEGT